MLKNLLVILTAFLVVGCAAASVETRGFKPVADEDGKVDNVEVECKAKYRSFGKTLEGVDMQACGAGGGADSSTVSDAVGTAIGNAIVDALVRKE